MSQAKQRPTSAVHGAQAQRQAQAKYGSPWLRADESKISRGAQQAKRKRYIPPQRYSTNPLVKRISVRCLASLFNLSEDRILVLLSRDAIHEQWGGELIIDETQAKRTYATLIK